MRFLLFSLFRILYTGTLELFWFVIRMSVPFGNCSDILKAKHAGWWRSGNIYLRTKIINVRKYFIESCTSSWRHNSKKEPLSVVLVYFCFYSSLTWLSMYLSLLLFSYGCCKQNGLLYVLLLTSYLLYTGM